MFAFIPLFTNNISTKNHRAFGNLGKIEKAHAFERVMEFNLHVLVLTQ